MITSFHGIGAYRGQRNPVALSKQLSTALSGVEICGADRPIGAFGAVFLGEATALFDHDCWSKVEGARVSDSDPLLTGDMEQDQYEAECKETLGLFPRSGHYSEVWVKPVALRAIWVKAWSHSATKKAAAIIARNRGVPLLTLSGNCRIWDLLDRQNLPLVVAA